MTGDKPRRTPWDDMMEYASEEPAPDARTEAVKAAIKPSLTAFGRRKEQLLDILCKAHKRGPKSKPFDADKAWLRLPHLVRLFLGGRTKQDETRGAKRVKRLHELAKALGNARAMIDKTMQDDVGDALCASWWMGTSEYTKAKRFFQGFFYIYDNGKGRFVLDIGHKFKKVVEKDVARLAALEAVAIRAADDVLTKRGRPKGTAILTQYNIEALAAVYRETTYTKPGASDGPFAKFVREFHCAGPWQYRIREPDRCN